MGTEKTKPTLRRCGCHKEMPEVRTALSPTPRDSWWEQPRQWVRGEGGLAGEFPVACWQGFVVPPEPGLAWASGASHSSSASWSYAGQGFVSLVINSRSFHCIIEFV